MKMRGEGRTINGVDYDDKLRDGHYKTQLTADINDKLKTVTHTPKDKWDVPQTSNQEIGWLAEVVLMAFRSALRKDRSSCTGGKDARRPITPTATIP